MAATMAGWVRVRGVEWQMHTVKLYAVVLLGKDGWQWAIFDRDQRMLAYSLTPTTSSRKARKSAQKMLAQLAAIRRYGTAEQQAVKARRLNRLAQILRAWLAGWKPDVAIKRVRLRRAA